MLNPYCDANENAEYCEPADVGPLPFPSIGPKLPDLECAALLSLPPLADCPGATAPLPGCSYGIALLPIGVANCNRGNEGRAGIEPGICNVRPFVAGALTGLAFGEGGMARPNLGALAPPFCRLPGIGGRNNGAGEDILGNELRARLLEDFESKV